MRWATFLVAALLGGCGGEGKGPKGPADPPPPSKIWRGALAGLELTLKADKSVYRAGETARVELSIRNLSGADVALTPEMREVLSQLEIMIYNLSAMMRAPVSPRDPVGEVLKPSAVIFYAADVSVERMGLYATPPASGGVHRQSFAVNAPSLPGIHTGDIRSAKSRALHSAYLKMFANGNIEIAVELDFGTKPPLAADYAEIAVTFKPGVKDHVAEAVIAKHGLYVRRSVPGWILYVPGGRSKEETVKALAAESSIEAVR